MGRGRWAQAHRRDGGQTSTEFIVVLALLGLIVVWVAGAGLAEMARTSLRSTVCDVLEDNDCGQAVASTGVPGQPGAGAPASGDSPVSGDRNGQGGQGQQGGPGDQGGQGQQGEQGQQGGGGQGGVERGGERGEGFLDGVLLSFRGALSATGDVLQDGANRAWHVGRLGTNGPVSILAWLYAEARGGDCHASPGLIFTCVNTRPQSLWQSTAFQVGNITISSEARVDPVVQGHETRHADQWAILGGGLIFPLLYGLEQLRVRGRRNRNLFERWAGLEEGGYQLPANPP